MKPPEPQSYLNDDARQIYYEIVKFLGDYNAIESVDSYGLSMMAHTLWMHHRAGEETSKIEAKPDGVEYINGPIQIFKNGTGNISPWFTVYDKTIDKFMKLSVKFGLSNKDRELMLKFKAKKQEQDKLDDI